MNNYNKRKSTLQKLEEKIQNTFPKTSENKGSEKEKIVSEILYLLREEYYSERDMVINFAIGITPRMNFEDITKKFDETFRL